MREKRALTLTRFNPLLGFGVYIKQAIQGLFTAGTSITRRSFNEGGHLEKMTGFRCGHKGRLR